MTEHTPDPWKVRRQYGKPLIIHPYEEDADGNPGEHIIGEVNDLRYWDETAQGCGSKRPMDNGRRIVACVNACEGLSTEDLEDGVIEEVLTVLAGEDDAGQSLDRLLTRTEKILVRLEGDYDR